jgi:serpin B
VSLRALWEVPFPESSTNLMPFTLADGSEVGVPTMRLRSQLRFHRGEGYTVADLAYRGGDFSMLILVPDAHDGLPSLEAGLTPALLAEAAVEGTTNDRILYLPRFSIASDIDLVEPLQDLGATLPFDPAAADFSGAAGAPGEIVLSTLIQKAVIRVNEVGTIAAAATGGGFELTSAPPILEANRPFLFVIRHRASGAVLFMGRVTDPR